MPLNLAFLNHHFVECPIILKITIIMSSRCTVTLSDTLITLSAVFSSLHHGKEEDCVNNGRKGKLVMRSLATGMSGSAGLK